MSRSKHIREATDSKVNPVPVDDTQVTEKMVSGWMGCRWYRLKFVNIRQFLLGKCSPLELDS